jgi:hypothetical protein
MREGLIVALSEKNLLPVIAASHDVVETILQRELVGGAVSFPTTTSQ